MALPIGPAPTLGEFITKARQHGAEVKHTSIVVEGPDGPVRFAYLWIDIMRFAPLPDKSSHEEITPDEARYLARRLDIPVDEFWPGLEEDSEE